MQERVRGRRHLFRRPCQIVFKTSCAAIDREIGQADAFLEAASKAGKHDVRPITPLTDAWAVLRHARCDIGGTRKASVAQAPMPGRR
jgi:hypothetical protein